MSIFEQAADEVAEREQSAERDPREPDPPTTTVAGETVPIEGRAATVTVGGEDVEVERPDTKQASTDTWLTGTGKYGVPRGPEALEARQIVQTSAMQAITNGIVDQLLGGDLAAESDSQLGGAAADVWSLLKDVLDGPHLMDDDLDDLITAAVEDMLGPGQAYWQMLGSANGGLPVASLIPLDPITIRHNVDRNGYPEDPPYYQAQGAFASGGVSSIGEVDPVPLTEEDLVVMRYPRGRRSHRFYPTSPSIQVKEWLEILSNSTTHHNRYYNDNELPPGVLQVLGASGNTVEDIKKRIQKAAGDPRKLEVIGGEGQAMWVEMGGTAVNLDVLGEQEWFFQLCLASLGLGKAEVGLIEDVNRANGEIEASRIYKRVTGPFAAQFENAFRHIAQQFDAFNALDDPFEIELRFTDPREEQARRERYRQEYQSGTRTYNQVQEAYGNDPSEIDTTVEVVDGVEVDYGEHPRQIVESVMIARRMEAMNDADEEDAEDAAEEMSAAFEAIDGDGLEDRVAELEELLEEDDSNE